MLSCASALLLSTSLNWLASTALMLSLVPTSILEDPFVDPPIIAKSLASPVLLVALTLTVWDPIAASLALLTALSLIVPVVTGSGDTVLILSAVTAALANSVEPIEPAVTVALSTKLFNLAAVTVLPVAKVSPLVK